MQRNLIMIKSKKVIFVSSLVAFVLWYVITLESTAIFMDKTLGTDLATTPYKPYYANIKFILQWTKAYRKPFIYMSRGQRTFMKRGCPINTCFVTSDRSLLGSIRQFDAILFHGPEIGSSDFGITKRSAGQKYVFVSTESSQTYPVGALGNIHDGFFNWTWTYRLDSDVYYGYVIIKNKQNDIIGPKETMHWPKIEEMEPIDNKIKQKLQHKRTAAAWFVSRCKVKSNRHIVGELLQTELSKYNLSVHVFGLCGNKYFPRYYMKKSLQYLEREFYFYLAFEDAISEDYVTEKILHALQHYTVPIVYGGANYTRFMPDGSYLVARPDNIQELAKQMFDIINDRLKYYNFFRWMNHFSYHYPEETPETDYYCDLCTKLHDVNLMQQKSSYSNISQWWNHDSIKNDSIISLKNESELA